MFLLSLWVLSAGKTYAVVFAGTARSCVSGKPKEQRQCLTEYYRMLGNTFHFMHFLETHGVPRQNIRAFFNDAAARKLHHKLRSFDGQTYGKDIMGNPYVADVRVRTRDRAYIWRVWNCLRQVPAGPDDVLIVYVRSHAVSKGKGMTAPNGHHWPYSTFVQLARAVDAGTVLFFIEGCNSCDLINTAAMEPFAGKNVLCMCSATIRSTAGKSRSVKILKKTVEARVGGLLLPSLLKRLDEPHEDMSEIAHLVLGDIREDRGALAMAGNIPRKSRIFKPPRQ